MVSDLPKYCDMSLGEFMDGITENERLKAALCYSFGDYGKKILE